MRVALKPVAEPIVGCIVFGTTLPWYSKAEGGDLAFLDTVDTPQIEPGAVETDTLDTEAATEVAMTTDGTGVTASASDTTDLQYGATTTLTVEEATDVFEVSCSGISTTSTSGSPGSPATIINLRYNEGSGWGGLGLNLPRALNTALPFTIVGSVTGLTPSASVDFAVEASALEVGGGGTVNHALTQLTLVVTRVKR